MNSSTLKTEIRKKLFALRAKIMHEDYELINAKSSQRVIEFFQKEFSPATHKNVGIYCNLINEVNINLAYKWLIEQGYNLSLSCFNAYNNKMDFREINLDWQSQKPFAWLPQVKFTNSSVAIARGDAQICLPDVLLIPCLGFNKKGFRLGYGKGYYDNYLRYHDRCVSVGIAQDDLEINSSSVAEDFDLLLSYIITSNRIINCK